MVMLCLGELASSILVTWLALPSIEETLMTECIYCGLDKEADQFNTLEHAIPQFLGGAHAPDRFKLRTACDECNRDLGLFVDGSFSKTWWVTNWLGTLWAKVYATSKKAAPLTWLGLTTLRLPEMDDGDVCEAWLGPLGEAVFLVRAKSERLYWYAGGDPIWARNKASKARAYFFFAKNSKLDLELTASAFLGSFRRQRVKKVLASELIGADPAKFGCKEPDGLDRARIEVLRHEIAGGAISFGVPVNSTYDQRFMCKLALGVGYSIFGSRFLRSPYTKALRDGLWNRADESSPVRGVPALAADRIFGPVTEFMGLDDAVCIIVQRVKDEVCVVLNIGRKLIWSIVMAQSDIGASTLPAGYEDGMAIILFPQLAKGLVLTFPDFLAHQLNAVGSQQLSELQLAASGPKKAN